MVCGMRNLITIILATVLAMTTTVFSEGISVSDTAGRSMEVEVLAYTQSSGNVRIKRLDDEKIFNVKIDMFDAASQKKIADAAPLARAKLNIEFSAGKRREKQKGSSFMETQKITASMRIRNDSRDIDFSNGKVTVLLIGRQTARFKDRNEDIGRILSRQDFNVSVKPGEEFEYECKPIVTEYDSDKDYTNVGGWEYHGYAYVVENEDGSIHTTDTSLGEIKKKAEEDPDMGKKLKLLNEGQTVGSDLKAR